MKRLPIAILGDYNPAYPPHPATNQSVVHAGQVLGFSFDIQWIPTPQIGPDHEGMLTGFGGIWAGPSPYANPAGVLLAIRFARENNIPFLGTCGGLMQATIEFCTNVLKLPQAAYDNNHPDPQTPVFVTGGQCQKGFYDLEISIEPLTQAGTYYPGRVYSEVSNCSFSINPAYYTNFEGHGLAVSAKDVHGDAKILELSGHPFFILTKFLPQMASKPGHPHPLIQKWLEMAYSLASSSKTPSSFTNDSSLS
jgi:CTP synthase (UTP-ammonia lyase)